jgi:hypothetical protein
MFLDSLILIAYVSESPDTILDNPFVLSYFRMNLASGFFIIPQSEAFLVQIFDLLVAFLDPECKVVDNFAL